ncbi:MAG: DUF4924 family protein [Luteibaculaceae bacterium]
MFDQIKKDNVVEYVIFMMYLHDLVRVHDFDIQNIMEQMVGEKDSSVEGLITLNDWFSDFIAQIKNEGLKSSGLISEVNEIIEELNFLHYSELNTFKSQEYITLYNNNLGYLEEYRIKHNDKRKSDIELILHSLYMVYLFKIQGKPITESTLIAVSGFKKIAGYIASRYNEIKYQK